MQVLPGVSWVLVYGVIVACGASFGGLTGYAMNMARDTAPRIAYQLLAPNKGKKDPDWAYGLDRSVVAPISGDGNLRFPALDGSIRLIPTSINKDVLFVN